jgi:Phosphotransferase enzyme family
VQPQIEQLAERPDLPGVVQAIEIARDHGLTVNVPFMLRSTNNVVAWLDPSPVVAKIGAGRASHLSRELAVALELTALGAPVVAPSPVPPPTVYRPSGVDITFWIYHPQDESGEMPVDVMAEAMHEIHRALSQLSVPLKKSLPPYTEELAKARSLLETPAALPQVSDSDRHLLTTTFLRLAAELDSLAPESSHQVIHGSPHSYNVLWSGGKPRFIDWETTCFGPLEWDLAHIGEEAAALYPFPVNSRLLWLCRAMASVKTAAFCFADAHRGDLAEHAQWHLAHIKGDVAPHLMV